MPPKKPAAPSPASPPPAIILLYSYRPVVTHRPPSLEAALDKARVLFSLSGQRVYLTTQVGPSNRVCEVDSAYWDAPLLQDDFREYTVVTRPWTMVDVGVQTELEERVEPQQDMIVEEEEEFKVDLEATGDRHEPAVVTTANAYSEADPAGGDPTPQPISIPSSPRKEVQFVEVVQQKIAAPAPKRRRPTKAAQLSAQQTNPEEAQDFRASTSEQVNPSSEAEASPPKSTKSASQSCTLSIQGLPGSNSFTINTKLPLKASRLFESLSEATGLLHHQMAVLHDGERIYPHESIDATLLSDPEPGEIVKLDFFDLKAR